MSDSFCSGIICVIQAGRVLRRKVELSTENVHTRPPNKIEITRARGIVQGRALA